MKRRDRWKLYSGTISDQITLWNGNRIIADSDQWFEHTKTGASIRLWRWADGWLHVVKRWKTDRVLAWHEADKDSVNWTTRTAALSSQ